MRVGLLAPMPSELRPVVKAFGLRKGRLGTLAGPVGSAGPHEVVATTSGIGTELAARAAERLLDQGEVDHVVVVGIAGGIGPSSVVRSLVVPASVEDWPEGRTHRPVPLAGLTGSGVLVTSDEYGYEPEVVAGFVERGVVAVDMETAAVAEVCVARGVPWSVVRAVSDPADGPTVDTEVISLVRADGSPDLGRSLRYVLRHPGRIPHLAGMGRDAAAAAGLAARTAAAAVADHT